MKKILFQVQNLIPTMFFLPWLNVVMVIVLVTAFLIPMTHFAWIQSNNKITDAAETGRNFDFQATFQAPVEQSKIEKNKIMEGIIKYNMTLLLARIPGLVNGESILVNVLGEDRNAIANDASLVKGRFPSLVEMKEKAPVGVVTLSFFQKHQLSLGDYIYVKGKEIQVIGVCIKAYSVPTVVVAMDFFDTMAGDSSVSYEMQLYTEEGINKADVFSVIQETFMADNINVLKVSEVERQDREVKRLHMASILQNTAFMLFLSVFSVLMMGMGYFVQKQHLYGIKLAMGATQGQIFLDMVIEMTIYAMIAVGLDLFLIFRFQNFFVWVIPVYTNYRLIFIGIGTGILYAISIAFFIWLYLFRKNPIQLIKE